MKLVVNDIFATLGIAYKYGNPFINFFGPVISKAKQKAYSVNDNISIVVQVEPHVGNMCTLHVGLYLHLHCCFVQTCIF
jgi:hypothetical protein